MRIEVQYDAARQTFKLVDQELRILLEGDALYDLAMPHMLEEAVILDSSRIERWAHENTGIGQS